MSRPPKREKQGPLQRAATELIARFQDGAYAVSQPFLLVDPPGYGAVRVLDEFARALQDAPASVAGFRVGSLPDRPDVIDGLPALLVEIAAIASSDPGDLQMWRRRVLDWQRDRDPAGFRAEIDRYLAEIFARVPGVILCVPRIDRMLTTLGSQDPREDWQFRGYVNNYPIRIVATAPSHLRITADDAFFQSFWHINPRLCDSEDLNEIAARLRLSQGAAAVLTDLASVLGFRPGLVERAAGLLAVSPDLSPEVVLREIANAPPASFLEQLDKASPQALKILAHLSAYDGPIDAGTVARSTNVSGSIVSTQMGRLADYDLVRIGRSASRDHRYSFADKVAQAIYKASVGSDALQPADLPITRAG